MEHWLRLHPNRQYVKYIVDGIKLGVKMGYKGPRGLVRFAHQKLLEVDREQHWLDNYMKEVQDRRMIDLDPTKPLPAPLDKGFITNSVRVIPKNPYSKKWRLIDNLSCKGGGVCINGDIDKHDFKLKFPTWDRACEMIRRVGRGCRLICRDARTAYKFVDLHPSCWSLQGLRVLLRSGVTVMGACPVATFGGTCFPGIYERFSSAIHWISKYMLGIELYLHLLDDHLMVTTTTGEAAKREEQEIVTKWEALCKDLGYLINYEKSEQGTSVKYLGIIIDTVAMVAKLPKVKLDRYLSHLKDFVHRTTQKVSVYELARITGQLCHASCVFPAGRTFLRRMYNLLAKYRLVPKRKRKYIKVKLSNPSEPHLNAIKDMKFWLDYLPLHNGVGFITDMSVTADNDIGLGHSSFKSSGDAGGVLGAVVYAPPGASCTRWYHRKWTTEELQLNIATRELICCLWAVWLFGEEWSGKRVRLYCDNEGVCNAAKKWFCRNHELMKVFRQIQVLAFKFQCKIEISWVPGEANILADALSRTHEQGQWARAFEHASPRLCSSPEHFRPLPLMDY